MKENGNHPWHRFVQWRGWKQCGQFFVKGWKATISWRFWRSCGRFFADSWKAVCAWTGWKKLFCLHPVLLALLAVFCGVGLALIFLNHREQNPIAYLIYVLAAYTLTAWMVKLPSLIRSIRQWFVRHPRITALLQNEELKFSLELYAEQFINFAYGIFKIAGGIFYGSAWIGADGIYNFSQALIQLFQILRRRRKDTRMLQWKSYRLCGVLVLLLHLTMTGLVFQMVNWGRAEDYPGYMIFATAAFAFYKIISAFVDVAKDRKHAHPVDSAVRLLDLSQAFFSMFSLQVSMIHVFGTGESWEIYLNAGTGCVVCLLVVSMGIYMIRRANREMKKLTGETT